MKTFHPAPQFLRRFLPGCLCLLFWAATSCKTLKLPPNDESSLDQWVVLDKGSCFGDCSMYTLTLFKNGFAKFEGKENAVRQGLYFRYLKAEEMEQVENAFNEIPFDSFQDHYISQVPDLQTVSITLFPDEGYPKTVKGKENRPPDILDLEDKLSSLALTGSWNEYKGGLFNAGGDGEMVVEEPPKEIIVQLQENVDPKKWINKFIGAKMQLVRQIAPNSNYYLMSFDPEARNPERLLELVRSDPEVIGAQFNQTVQSRN